MRDIEFRAWNGREMCQDFTIDADDGMPRLVGYSIHGEPTDAVPHWKLMQFTGAKDNLGTKVFEGDIVFLDAKMITGEIVMDCFAWKIKDRDEYYWLCDFYEDVQVVGNVHQHPHLLEQKK